MKLLWLSNLAPGPVQDRLGKSKKGGLWMDHVLEDLRKDPAMELMLLCPAGQVLSETLDEHCAFETFPKLRPEQVDPELKNRFVRVLREFQPDVIHIWGTEFAHTLSMMEAARDLDLLDRTVIGIQGLTTYCDRHFAEGIPVKVQKGYTFRDFVRQDNILQQARTFYRRGQNEQKALALAKHVMGRTHWDRACMAQLAPNATYHFCNETLRETFYGDTWHYESCQPHRIFVSNCLYPIKGFHYALEALAIVRRRFPDAVLAVSGKNPAASTFKEKLRQDGYAKYLCDLTDRLDLHGSVEYLGSLSAEQMKEQYRMANAFILPSCLENSSNSLGEAMLLGMPCVAADVGGTATLLENGREGLLYQGTAPYMLADCLERVFDMGKQAQTMGQAARAHALKTHDPKTNLQTLLDIYHTLGKEENP